MVPAAQQQQALSASSSTPPPPPPPVLLADHAGSGKTLAYLVPAIQAIADAEAAGARPSSGPRPPSALCLVPTAELAAQVLATARGLARGGGPAFRSVGLTGGRPWRTQRDALAAGCDLVVATPGRAAAALADGALDVRALHTLVLDEADVLLAAERTDGGGAMSGPEDDEELSPGGPPAGFVEQVRPILHAAGPRGRGPGSLPPPRLVLVTATVPEPTYRDWAASFPGLTPVLGPGLHRTAPGVTQRLIDCSFGVDGDGEDDGESGRADPDAAFQRKADALVRLLRDDAARAGGPGPAGAAATPGHAIVFVHTVAAARRVENLLARRLGGLVTPLAYHAAVSPDARAAHLGAIARPPPPLPPATPTPAGSLPSEHRRLVLIATDRASRGIDTAHADHVVLFDFPRDPSEYVRRAGRVARGAGGGGVVSLLATGRAVRIARDLVERGAKGLPVHRVPGADV